MEGANTTKTILEELLGNYEIGTPLQDGALQVFPLHRRARTGADEIGAPGSSAVAGDAETDDDAAEGTQGSHAKPDVGATAGKRAWKLAEEALADGSAVVREVDESGSVGQLLFDNQGDAHALLLDGVEVRGCKQNRMVNTTILAGAGQTTPIDVSCVEAGRWNYRSRTFSHSGRMVAASLRNRKAHMVKASLERSGRPTTDQNAVWATVDELLDVEACASPTRALDDAYEELSKKKDPGKKSLDVTGDGAVVVIGGRILGLDLLADHATFAGFWKSASEGYALDAAHAPADKTATRAEVESWLSFLATGTNLRPIEVPGVGEHYGVDGPGVSGSVLLFEGDLVHAALFPVLG